MGGSTLKECCKRIMGKLVANELCTTFNWSGKTCWKSATNATKKFPFPKLALADVVKSKKINLNKCCLRNIFLTPSRGNLIVVKCFFQAHNMTTARFEPRPYRSKIARVITRPYCRRNFFKTKVETKIKE